MTFRVLMPGPMGLAREQLHNATIPATPLGVRSDGQVVLGVDSHHYEKLVQMWRLGWLRTLGPGEAQGVRP